MPSERTPKPLDSTNNSIEDGVAQTETQSQHVAQDATAPANELPGQLPAEHGGQQGLEPTRYGDWEKKGRCTDF